MADWSTLLPGKQGLAVEGMDDKMAVEAFLEAGKRAGHWANWRDKVEVKQVGKSQHVIREADQPNIWGLIDRDWRTDEEVQALQTSHPRLIILPRIMIENYLIDPDDLMPMLPSNRIRGREKQLRSRIEAELSRWQQHGVLSRVLWERGAHYFCRNTGGYPQALLAQPGLSDAGIRDTLAQFINQLDPDDLLAEYHRRLNQLPPDLTMIYSHHIDGKMFFNQAVVTELNRQFGQRSRDQWFSDLFLSRDLECPAELIPLLLQIVNAQT